MQEACGNHQDFRCFLWLEMVALDTSLPLLIQTHAFSSEITDLLVENFETTTLSLIPPPFCGLDFSFRTLYFQIHPLPHPPPPHHHLDRFGTTCSLHSQEDGKDSSCQILSFILRCLQQCPLRRFGRRKPCFGSASWFCAWTEWSLCD